MIRSFLNSHDVPCLFHYAIIIHPQIQTPMAATTTPMIMDPVTTATLQLDPLHIHHLVDHRPVDHLEKSKQQRRFVDESTTNIGLWILHDYLRMC